MKSTTRTVEPLISGIHSRSEDLVKTTRDYDRGRTDKALLDSAFQSDAEALLSLQEGSGFSQFSDGQLRWQDFIRPFSESVSGLESGADLSRWFDTNSFYKRPTVTKNISTDGSFILNYTYGGASADADRSIAVPGPYTLASLVDDEFYQSRVELVHGFSKVLRKVISKLSASGYKRVQINEPSLVYKYGMPATDNPKYLEAFLSAFKENLSNLEGTELILHTYFGDCSGILEDLVELPGVSTVGVDFTETSLEKISATEFDGKKLACGCVDSRSSLIESPEWIVKFCDHAVRALKPSGLVIIPSTDLKYLPRTHADQKVRAIGRAAAMKKKEKLA